MNWAEFFHMGGYAFYVWTSWGLTALVIAYQVVQPKLVKRRLKNDILRQNARKALAKAQNDSSNSN